MPVRKTNTVIADDIVLPPGGSPVFSQPASCMSGWHKMLFLSFTNGANPPSSLPSVLVQTSPDCQHFYDCGTYNGTGYAGRTNTATQLIYAAAPHLRLVWTPAVDGDPVTVRAELCEVADISDEFVTADRRNMVVQNQIIVTTATEQVLLPAQGPNSYADIKLLVVTNTDQTSVRMDLRDSLGGTVRLSVWCPAGDTIVVPTNPPLPQEVVNSAWTVQLSATIHDMRITAVAIKNVT
jgi:hypothetical protein